ncbi:MAG: molybdopterin-dependent oxidoreductase, partial [Woeseiaceae bacterium]
AKVDCYAMYTNNTPAGAFRGFGVTQSAFAVESNMDMLAEELGIDPFELRRINALRLGSTTATGQVLDESVGLLDCIDWVRDQVQELEKGPAPDTAFANPRIGWGLACAYKNTGFGGGAPDSAGAEVEVYPDDATMDVQVRASSADLGQGLTTVVAQIAATVAMERSELRTALGWLLVTPFVLGLYNFIQKAFLGDSGTIENTIEWIVSLLMQLWFIGLYIAWRNARFEIVAKSG